MDDFTDWKSVVPPKNLSELSKTLHEVFSRDDVNVEYVHALMSQYKSNPKEWRKYAKFDPHKYTRNLVDSGNDRFNLIVLCWGEGHGSSIHSHANSHCFMKILDGTLKEKKYDWPNEGEEEHEMECIEENVLESGQVAYINDSLGLHRVENPSNSNTAVSLHLYSPPIKLCESFDQRTGHRTQCKVTFWSVNGEKTQFQKKVTGWASHGFGKKHLNAEDLKEKLSKTTEESLVEECCSDPEDITNLTERLQKINN